MRHFQLPHCGTSGSGTGWGLDLAALESYWMNNLLTCLSGGSLAPFVGDTLGAKAFSPLTVVYVHEMITQVQQIVRGFSLDKDSFSLSEIDQAGPGGNFLLAPSTLERFRQAYYTSPFNLRWSMEKWQSQGSPSSFDLLRGYTQYLLSQVPFPPDHDYLLQRGQALIRLG
jgi:trimethylamine--corrinoid protein Co-methyltransferase